MNDIYGTRLDLNLLRVFLVVADRGSVTAAASQLYLTQPAVSAALRRLTDAVGAPLLARQGRGVALTSRGTRLAAAARPHVAALVEAALAPAHFEPATSERTVRLGLSDAGEAWLLPALLRTLAREAPRMRLIVQPVQFRTVAEALASRRLDAAVTVADELPSSIRRRALFDDTFVCLFDPRHVRLPPRPSERDYFAREHVIVSYNGDLRGIVEDLVGKARSVRCSVASFHNLGPIVDGSALVATVPALVAEEIRRTRPHLRTARPPFRFEGVPMELLWPAVDDDDAAGGFVRERIVEIAGARAARRHRARRDG
ncbi:MAG TPA: LysR family transcriptional regulator [Polyangia bacterium]|nr:LysR family transcriptional regulator [Polyangia bacterium]